MSTQICGCDPPLWVCQKHRTVNLNRGVTPKSAETIEQCLERSTNAKQEFTIKDSGVRKEFASGSLRDITEGKVNYGKVLDGPMFERWAVHLTNGAKKYPDTAPGVANWTLISTPEELARYKESAFRHFMQWYRGETDEDHAAATIFNINGVEHLKTKGVK